MGRKLSVFLVVICFSILFGSVGFSQSKSQKIETYMSGGRNITEALKLAMASVDTLYFGQGVYELDSFIIENRKNIYWSFSNTTLKAASKSSVTSVLRFKNIENLTFIGKVVLNGNYPVSWQKENFLDIVSPSSGIGHCKLGDLFVLNNGRSGIQIMSADPMLYGYGKITVKSYHDINGNGCASIDGNDNIYGLHIRGGHKIIRVDEVELRHDKANWTNGDTLPGYKNFSVTAEVDPINYPRPDSLIVGKLHGHCAMSGLYVQAVTNVYLEQIVLDSMMRKPHMADDQAYKHIVYKNYAFLKASWSNFHVKSSSFRVKKFEVKNTNPYLQKEDNFMIGFWLNSGVVGAKIDSLITDVPIALSGDGQHPEVGEGRHTIDYLKLDVPAKPSTSIFLAFGIKINHLVFGDKHGLTVDIRDCEIKRITQIGSNQISISLQSDNVYSDKVNGSFNGAIIRNVESKNLKWQFYLRSKNGQNIIDRGIYRRYEFENFSGTNILQVFVIHEGASQDFSNKSVYKEKWVNDLFKGIVFRFSNCKWLAGSESEYTIYGDIFDFLRSDAIQGNNLSGNKSIFTGSSINSSNSSQARRLFN
jgi:hypothetical protein